MEVIGVCIILEATLMNNLCMEALQKINLGVVVYQSSLTTTQESIIF
jgi:hypothetical protein